ncbi:MAG TPA: hypothetical protein VI749_08760 [Candidatus Omnitrophota bacterium]|nr:hypothetical protein [Candidatus Omnitrophota bacterium]
MQLVVQSDERVYITPQLSHPQAVQVNSSSTQVLFQDQEPLSQVAEQLPISEQTPETF